VLIAITRGISPRIHECELTHLEREPIDLDRARRQHRQYEECLAELGCEVLSLPPEPDLPDSVFVEDTALVLDELAVIMRPGAASRRPETASIATALAPYRKLSHIKEPGTIDGGDVLRVGKDIFVGLSRRSNVEGIVQLQEMLAPFGYRVNGVSVRDCLHLKSAVTQVSADTLLINRECVDPRKVSKSEDSSFSLSKWVDGLDDHLLPKMRLIEVDPSEPNGGNAIWIRDSVVYPAAFPITLQKLRDAGLTVHVVDASELAKAEAGVTCCSLIFAERAG
jgi:dimethylargininase